MKKHLFGLGAMIVGAGLTFVLMHGEVSAGNVTQIKCENFEFDNSYTATIYTYCQIKDLTCVSKISGISCVKS